MKTGRTLAGLACLCIWFAMPARAQDPAAGAAVLSFEFDERPAKREIPIPPYYLTLVCAEDKRYQATHTPVAAEGAAPDTVRSEGELSSAEWEQLQGALKALDLPADLPAKLDIGYGTSLDPGWEGRLTFTVDGVQRQLAFTSLRPAGEAERPAELNRLVTLVFDLKNFALAKLQRLPARARPPGELVQ